MIHCPGYHPLMAATPPITTLNTEFSSPEAAGRPWSEVERVHESPTVTGW
jgi:hypothetical protein